MGRGESFLRKVVLASAEMVDGHRMGLQLPCTGRFVATIILNRDVDPSIGRRDIEACKEWGKNSGLPGACPLEQGSFQCQGLLSWREAGRAGRGAGGQKSEGAGVLQAYCVVMVGSSAEMSCLLLV